MVGRTCCLGENVAGAPGESADGVIVRCEAVDLELCRFEYGDGSVGKNGEDEVWATPGETSPVYFGVKVGDEPDCGCTILSISVDLILHLPRRETRADLRWHALLLSAGQKSG